MALIVLPTQGSQLPGGRLPAALAASGAIEIEPVFGPDGAWDARVCAGIGEAEAAFPVIASEPLRILAIGDAAQSLPAVARANRACHRAISEYLLLEPDLPPTSEAWPDAPVVVFTDDPSIDSLARLRGWTVQPAHRLADTLVADD